MEKAEINALLTAHGGRAHAVASLHVLRAPALSDADHSFLAGRSDALATLDLQRWLGLAREGHRAAVLDALARLAEKDPGRFEYEIARAPHFGLEKGEQTHLVERLRGRVPSTLLAALSPAPAAPAAPAKPAKPANESPEAFFAVPATSLSDGFFDPSDILGEAGFGADSGSPGSEGLGDLLGDGDFFGDSGASTSRCPALDALLTNLATVKGPKARAAWKDRALSLARDVSEDWSPVVTRLPRELRDAVLSRAAESPRPEERAALLEWLFQNGARQTDLVRLTMALLSLGQQAQNVRPWLAESWIPKLLGDKAAWSRHGVSLLAALVEQYAFSEMDELFTAVMTGAGALGPGRGALSADEGGTKARGAAAFAAFAKMLIEGLRLAMKQGERKAVLARAAALACLGVRASDVAELRELRRKRAAKGEVATLVGLAEKTLRGPRTPAKLEDLVAAVHVLSDAVS
jgi:hypothetical protein